jgi:hypothetical protein
MKLLLFVTVLLIILFFLLKKPVVEQEVIYNNNMVPRQKPVYIDPVTVYLNEPILYDEWPQAPCEISSSL